METDLKIFPVHLDDYTRVRLRRGEGDEDTDYINASFIKVWYRWHWGQTFAHAWEFVRANDNSCKMTEEKYTLFIRL